MEDIVLRIVLTLAIGVLAGFLGGLFGMGGGVVLVPAFLALFGWIEPGSAVTMKQAVGTSLFLVIPAGWGAVRKQYSLGNLDGKFCARWIPFVAIGALLGAALSLLFHGTVLKIVFLSYLLVCIVVFVVFKDKKGGGSSHPHGWIRRVGGLVIGAFSVMLGIGGGTLAAPFLKVHGCSLKKALGLSSATTIAVGIVGSIGMMIIGWGVSGRVPYSIGYVSMVASVLCAPLMFWVSPIGVSVAHKMPKSWLQAAYVVFLMVVFGYMLWHTVAL
jgi:uncharacterized protein